MSLTPSERAEFIRTGRSVKEWIGKTPDTPVPPRVKLRVFEAYEGRCYLSGVKIQPGMAWEVEHKLALCLGGENRETNLAPALKAPHRAKSADDVARKSKADRVRIKHLGLKPKGRGFAGWRKFNGEIVRKEER